jgi:hypothetical protein
MMEYEVTDIHPADTRATRHEVRDAQTTAYLTNSPGYFEVLQEKKLASFSKVTNNTGIEDPFWSFKLRETSDQKDTKRDVDVLEAFAKTENVDLFLSLLDTLMQSYRTGDEYLRAVQLCLSLELHAKARQLAFEGAGQYTEHQGLQRMKRLLGPAKVLYSDLPADPTAAANMDWLRQNADEYRGQYVAVKDGKLLAVARSYQELFQTTGPVKGKGILVTKVF